MKEGNRGGKKEMRKHGMSKTMELALKGKLETNIRTITKLKLN